MKKGPLGEAGLRNPVPDQVNGLIERTSDHEDADTIRAAGTHLTEGITEWEGELLQPKQKTYQDVVN